MNAADVLNDLFQPEIALYGLFDASVEVSGHVQNLHPSLVKVLSMIIVLFDR